MKAFRRRVHTPRSHRVARTRRPRFECFEPRRQLHADLPPLFDLANVGLDAVYSAEALQPISVGDQSFFPAVTHRLGSTLWQTDGTLAGTRIVRDSVSRPLNSAGQPRIVANDQIYFFASDESGQSLWTSDGTEAGTRSLEWSREFPANAIRWMGPLREGFVMAVLSPQRSFRVYELYYSDGSQNPPTLLREFNNRNSEGEPYPRIFDSVFDLNVVEGQLWLGRTSEDANELWTSDGTVAGTRLFDRAPGLGFRYQTDSLLVQDGNVMVIREAGDQIELIAKPLSAVSSDPATVLRTYAGSAETVDLQVLRGDVYLHFAEADQIVRSDGTVAGTVDFDRPANWPGEQGIPFVDVDGRAIAEVISSAGQPSLVQWMADGSIETWVQFDRGNLVPVGFGDEHFVFHHEVGRNTLAHRVSAPGGTPELLAGPLGPDEFHSSFASINDGSALLTIVLRDGSQSLWRWDAAEQTTTPLQTFRRLQRRSLTAVDERHDHFRFFLSDFHAVRLYETDRIEGGDSFPIWSLENANLRATSKRNDAGVSLFVTTRGGVNTLWRTDGTSAGTRSIRTLSIPDETFDLRAFDHQFLFIDRDPNGHRELWRTDGTAEGTSRVSQVPIETRLDSAIESGGELYFFSRFQGLASLSKYDFQTDAITHHAWIEDGDHYAVVGGDPAVAVGDRHYFARPTGIVAGGATTPQLWSFDVSTLEVRRAVLPGGQPLADEVNRLFAVAEGTSVVFEGRLGQQRGLYRWNGDADLPTLIQSTDPQTARLEEVHVAHGKLFYVLSNKTESSQALWVRFDSDPGSHVVETSHGGSGWGSIETVVDDRLYFRQSDATYGEELWVTDGMSQNTFLAADIAAGRAASEFSIADANGNLLFGIGTTDTYGMAPYLLPIADLGLDFGDAPTTFPQTAAHRTVGPRLGPLRDVELEAWSSSTAGGDGRDEDGVLFGHIGATSPLAAMNVDVQNLDTRNVDAAFVDAWVDFNHDGDWDDLGEQIFASRAVVNGLQTLNFVVPDGATVGETFARVRISSSGGLSAGGRAGDGEVEDYRVVISHDPLPVVDVAIDGTTRSIVDAIEVRWPGLIAVDSSMFELRNETTGEVVDSIRLDVQASESQTTVRLAFEAGTSVQGGSDSSLPLSLADGTYALIFDRGGVSSLPQRIATFTRAYGDIDGNGTVDLLDFAALRAAFGSTSVDGSFENALDANRDGRIDLLDFRDFRERFGRSTRSLGGSV